MTAGVSNDEWCRARLRECVSRASTVGLYALDHAGWRLAARVVRAAGYAADAAALDDMLADLPRAEPWAPRMEVVLAAWREIVIQGWHRRRAGPTAAELLPGSQAALARMIAAIPVLEDRPWSPPQKTGISTTRSAVLFGAKASAEKSGRDWMWSVYRMGVQLGHGRASRWAVVEAEALEAAKRDGLASTQRLGG